MSFPAGVIGFPEAVRRWDMVGQWSAFVPAFGSSPPNASERGGRSQSDLPLVAKRIPAWPGGQRRPCLFETRSRIMKPLAILLGIGLGLPLARLSGEEPARAEKPPAAELSGNKSQPPPAFRIQCQTPGVVTESAADGTVVLSIKGGSGIGHATITRHLAQWPRAVVVRAYLRGLESLVISNTKVSLEISVLSHSGHPTLLHLRQDGTERLPLTKDSPYWTDVRRLDDAGKPVTSLPPAGGWFETRVPSALLTDMTGFELKWIDFYR